jgi:hypothetical protein
MERIIANLRADNARMAATIAELTAPPPEPMIALKDAAFDAHVSIEGARKMILRGEVIGAKVNGQWRVVKSSLMDRARGHWRS